MCIMLYKRWFNYANEDVSQLQIISISLIFLSFIHLLMFVFHDEYVMLLVQFQLGLLFEIIGSSNRFYMYVEFIFNNP